MQVEKRRGEKEEEEKGSTSSRVLLLLKRINARIRAAMRASAPPTATGTAIDTIIIFGLLPPSCLKSRAVGSGITRGYDFHQDNRGIVIYIENTQSIRDRQNEFLIDIGLMI